MKKHVFQFTRGFTLIEMLVIIGITTLLSGMFLANYREGEKPRNVRIAADSLASALRLMQNNTLAGLAHPVPDTATCAGLRDYMVTVDKTASGNTRYITTVEEKDAAGLPCNRRDLETVSLPSNVVVENIQIDTTAPGGPTVLDAMAVRFFPPFGKITMKALACPSSCAPYLNETEAVVATFDVAYQGSSFRRTLHIDGLSGRIEAR